MCVCVLQSVIVTGSKIRESTKNVNVFVMNFKKGPVNWTIVEKSIFFLNPKKWYLSLERDCELGPNKKVLEVSYLYATPNYVHIFFQKRMVLYVLF